MSIRNGASARSSGSGSDPKSSAKARRRRCLRGYLSLLRGFADQAWAPCIRPSATLEGASADPRTLVVTPLVPRCPAAWSAPLVVGILAAAAERDAEMLLPRSFEQQPTAFCALE